MANTNRRSRIRYCKDCEYWKEKANLVENIHNAADTRDVTIYCPQGFDLGTKRDWYSPAVCMKNTEVTIMPKLTESYATKEALV